MHQSSVTVTRFRSGVICAALWKTAVGDSAVVNCRSTSEYVLDRSGEIAHTLISATRSYRRACGPGAGRRHVRMQPRSRADVRPEDKGAVPLQAYVQGDLEDRTGADLRGAPDRGVSEPPAHLRAVCIACSEVPEQRIDIADQRARRTTSGRRRCTWR
mmetsp:Transcript_22531/g.45139  ORF Transcript_22531/g.45139 Transcript_22531/m.45139 type:complete len:158 (-) Transcript_22531:73-546(-)